MVEVLGPKARLRRSVARVSLLDRDGLVVMVVAFWVLALALVLPDLLVQDSWLSFVDGRLVAAHWLPYSDTLTTWTVGRRWIDQQWAAHLVLYELVRYGGMRAAFAAGIACVAGALTAVAVAARLLGGSPTRTGFALLVPVVAAPWMAQIRSQIFALPLFVLVYGLLALEERRPGRRVLLVLPLLVLWANLHGSVALGAGLAVLHGLRLLLRRPARLRGAALVVGAPLTLLASPYGLHLVSYYRLMLLHPPLASFVSEWRPAAVTGATAVFFVSAFALCALGAVHRRALTVFERFALPLLLVAALVAVRNTTWFELAGAVALPRLLDAARPAPAGIARLNRGLAAVALAAAAIALALELPRAPARVDSAYPPGAAAAIARAAGPGGLVLADEAHADWLLWEQPSLAGRVAFDVRFELFDRAELQQLKLLKAGSRPVWRRCGAQARVVVFEGPAGERPVLREGVLAPGFRTIVRRSRLVAVVQPRRAAGPACRL